MTKGDGRFRAEGAQGHIHDVPGSGTSGYGCSARTADAFANVAYWVFDLDNTLYSPSVNLFAQIEARLNTWMIEALGMTRNEADRLRVDYWERYGTTLAGLVMEHGVDPGPVVDAIHDVSLEALRPDLELAEAIGRLRGRRMIFTNASAGYARRVLEARGLADVFDAVYGIEEAGFRCKPGRSAYRTVFELAGIEPRVGAMFDDDPRNLEVPFSLGMRTVHVSESPMAALHISHHTSDLVRFLVQIASAIGPQT